MMPDWFPSSLPGELARVWAAELVWMLLAGWSAGLISLVLTGIRAKRK